MRAKFVACLVLMAACGNPLVGRDYRGEVLATLDGTVLMDAEGYEWPTETLRVALFWATDDGIGTEQSVVVETSFPARYTLSLYQPPPEDALFDTDWSSSQIAVATPLLYEDVDGDGVWDEDVDDIVGGSPDIALVWSAGESAEAVGVQEDWFIDLQPGFQRMWTDQSICLDERETTYFPADDEKVNLYVGPYWDWFTDWDCNGDLDEWSEFCPPEEELTAWLEGDPTLLVDSPDLLWCAELYGLVPTDGGPVASDKESWPF